MNSFFLLFLFFCSFIVAVLSLQTSSLERLLKVGNDVVNVLCAD